MEDLDTIDAIRKRPGMYIGDPHDGSGLHQTLMEVLANSLDQHFAGKLARIDVALTSDGGIVVTDDGEGISTKADEHGVSFLERVFTEMHDTPTADGHAPHIHLLSLGLGLCTVCAVSRTLTVTTGSGPRVRQEFAQGRALGPAVVVDSSETGTCVEWVPDPEVFSTMPWNPTKIAQRLRDITHLAPGLTTSLSMAPQTWGPVTDLRPLVRDMVDGHSIIGEAILCTAQDGPMSASVALLWCDAPSYRAAPEVVSYCNLMRTHDGGSHVKGLLRGTRDVLRQTFEVVDQDDLDELTRGLRAVVSVSLIDPSFGAPTRDLLKNPEAHTLVRLAIVKDLNAALSTQTPLREALAKRLLPAAG
ncbi:MAG: DNA gyrase subunit B [Polyangiales bacterium]|jgi:DNA gyrase subunit B